MKTENGHFRNIVIIRIICQTRKRERKETGVPLQYTLTLLPAFLAPHGKVPVVKIENAINAYTSNNISTTEAAMLMYCENEKSFSLYFNRAKEKIKHWISILIQMTLIMGEYEPVHLENTINTNQMSQKWNHFNKLLADYFHLYQKNPHHPIISFENYFTAYHSKLTIQKMSLGP